MKEKHISSQFFSFRLKKLRIEKRLSQNELAKILNVSQTTIAKWEKQEQEPSIKIIKQLAEIFEVNIDYLYGNDKKTQKEIEYLKSNEYLTDTNNFLNIEQTKNISLLLKNELTITDQLKQNKIDEKNYYFKKFDIDNNINKIIFSNEKLKNSLLNIDYQETLELNEKERFLKVTDTKILKLLYKATYDQMYTIYSFLLLNNNNQQRVTGYIMNCIENQ